jgi:hypothetical protein
VLGTVTVEGIWKSPQLKETSGQEGEVGEGGDVQERVGSLAGARVRVHSFLLQ